MASALAALLVVLGTFRGIIAYFILATVAFITLSVADWKLSDKRSLHARVS